MKSAVEAIQAVNEGSTVDRSSSISQLSLSGETSIPFPDEASLRSPSTLAHMDKQMQAIQVIVRLSQPFSALLLTWIPHLGRVAACRFATESLITVQVGETTPGISKKLNSVRMLRAVTVCCPVRFLGLLFQCLC